MMSDGFSGLILRIQNWSQIVAMGLVAMGAVAAVGSTALAAAGVLPWFEVPVRFGDAEPAFAGMVLQIGITITLLILCVFLPSNIRVMRLEATHRDFSLKMDDVTRAYWAAHAADRTGVFNLQREYDAVRERLQFLREHPDLHELDQDLLEVAAQMSHVSRELARIYSDEKITRAREHLALRRDEAERMNDRIVKAHAATAEIRRLKDEVEVEEDVVRSRIARLSEELADILSTADMQDVGGRPEDRRRRIGIVPKE